MSYIPRHFIFIVLSLFIIIAFIPLFYMLLGSFWSDGLTLGYYASLLNTSYIKTSLNSLIIAFSTTFFSLLIGIPQAFILQRTNVFGKGFFKVVYLVPLLVPAYIHAIVWIHLLSKNGWINQFLSKVFQSNQAFSSIYGIQGVILVLTLAYSPIITAMVISGLKSVDYQLEEAALINQPYYQVLRKITLPSIAPHILSGAIFVFIFSIINFGVPDLLRVKVYPTEIFIQFSAYYDEKAASALSAPLILLTVFLIMLTKRVMQNRPYITITGDFKPAPIYKLNKKLKATTFLFVFILFLFSTIIPIAILVKKSGALSNYGRILVTSYKQINYSIILAFIGAIIMVSLSLFISHLIERGGRWSNILEFSTLIPFAVPGTVLGIGLIKVWNHPSTQFIYGSSLIILIAYVAHFIPFTIRIILSDMKSIHAGLEEAAFLTTPSWFYVLRRIIVPLASPGLLISLFIGFLLCFGDLATTLLTIPPGRETVPIKVYNYMHYGAENLVSALCIIIILVILIVGSIFYVSFKKLVKV